MGISWSRDSANMSVSPPTSTKPSTPTIQPTPVYLNMSSNTKTFGNLMTLSSGQNSTKPWQSSKMPKRQGLLEFWQRNSKLCPLPICDMPINMSMISSSAMQTMNNGNEVNVCPFQKVVTSWTQTSGEEWCSWMSSQRFLVCSWMVEHSNSLVDMAPDSSLAAHQN